MPVCSRIACKKTYEGEDNSEQACNYHAGAPVFHEGLKSWSCCPKKTVLDFEEFMQIEGCEFGPHIPEVENPKAPPPTPITPLATPLSSDGVTETFSGGPSAPVLQATSTPAPTTITPLAAPLSSKGGIETFTGGISAPVSQKPPVPTPITPPTVVEDEDDLTITVSPGTQCKRNGCRNEFVSDEVSRNGDGEGTVCSYHPGAPIFHEGSKGYFCCRRRVLEFDEFLKIEGCKTGRHIFALKQLEPEAEIQAECRIDHYQTPQQVCVTIFAKGVDKTKSSIVIGEEKIDLDLFLPGSKRFKRTLNLYDRVTPERSNFMIMGIKVEINLQKEVGRSWNLLEKSDKDLGNYSLTFGVAGRTGTTGAKEAVLSQENMANA